MQLFGCKCPKIIWSFTVFSYCKMTYDKKETVDFFQASGLQLPMEGEKFNDFFGYIIPNETDLVNLRKANSTTYSIRKVSTIDKMVLMSIRRYLELWVFNIERYANKKRSDHWLKTLSLAEAHNGLLVVDSFNLSTIIPDETDLGKLKRERTAQGRYAESHHWNSPCIHPIRHKEKCHNRNMLRQTATLTSIMNIRIIYIETKYSFITWKSPARLRLARLFFLFFLISFFISSFLFYLFFSLLFLSIKVTRYIILPLRLGMAILRDICSCSSNSKLKTFAEIR